MDAEPTVWQIGAGSWPRSYFDDFLKHQVALIGPGDTGPWKADRSDADFEGRFVRHFASEVQVGDILVLRSGKSSIRAVGIVASDYLYLNQFDDVNGWDLQHGRRVRWYPLPEEQDFGGMVFGAYPSRFSGVGSDEVVNFALRFVNSPPKTWQHAALPELPAEEPELHEIPESLRGIVGEVQDLVGLIWQGESFGANPSESELVAHLVVPFLRALGWPPELIAVEWNNVDVALFQRLPRIPENCHLLIEAKGLGAGVEGALEQVKAYAKSLTVSCDVVVTDGIRYRMYSCQQHVVPLAYANMGRLKKNALELFTRMKRP